MIQYKSPILHLLMLEAIFLLGAIVRGRGTCSGCHLDRARVKCQCLGDQGNGGSLSPRLLFRMSHSCVRCKGARFRPASLSAPLTPDRSNALPTIHSKCLPAI